MSDVPMITRQVAAKDPGLLIPGPELFPPPYTALAASSRHSSTLAKAIPYSIKMRNILAYLRSINL